MATLDGMQAEIHVISTLSHLGSAGERERHCVYERTLLSRLKHRRRERVGLWECAGGQPPPPLLRA